jgi:hypothetical protein
VILIEENLALACCGIDDPHFGAAAIGRIAVLQVRQTRAVGAPGEIGELLAVQAG